jgi:hypothetical protein
MAKALIGYRRGPKLFLVPLGRVPSGGHIEVEPVSALDLDTPAADVGRSIVDTLELSDKQFDDPPVEALRSPAQVAAGSKSWRQFIHGTASCDVEQRENGYVITPLRPEKGTSFGYEPERAVTIPLQVAPETLGQAFLEVLRSCEEH